MPVVYTEISESFIVNVYGEKSNTQKELIIL